MQLSWTEIAPKHWTESAFVVFGGTFFAYIMMMKGQKVLTPTQVSVYNYVQPIVSTMLAMAWGIATLGWMQGVAIALVFAGVQLVARKK
jgi:drug/metabolite transporter (DMT)-like permease